MTRPARTNHGKNFASMYVGANAVEYDFPDDGARQMLGFKRGGRHYRILVRGRGSSVDSMEGASDIAINFDLRHRTAAQVVLRGDGQKIPGFVSRSREGRGLES